MDTAVVLVFYRRPEHLRSVFEKVRLARPDRLFLVADGWKSEQEKSRCLEARSVVGPVDWPCEVHRNYSDVNMGCQKRMTTGLDWVFGQVERAIVLEDDCVPDLSFFRFCEELLERYRDDRRVMAISGNNFQKPRQHRTSYYFSAYPHCWGWATWRRAWALMDFSMNGWDAFCSSSEYRAMMSSRREQMYWRGVLASIHRGETNSWGGRWALSCWRNGGLAALPHVNLVSNAGFGPGGTNCRETPETRHLRTEPMSFPLVHPRSVERSRNADKYTFNTCFAPEVDVRTAMRTLRWTIGASLRRGFAYCSRFAAEKRQRRMDD